MFLGTGMVYPSEGLFYIEMDQTPPGKLGLKGAFVSSICVCGEVWRETLRGKLSAFLVLLASCGIVCCSQVDIQQKKKKKKNWCAGAEEEAAVTARSCVQRSPQRRCPGMHSAIHLPIT